MPEIWIGEVVGVGAGAWVVDVHFDPPVNGLTKISEELDERELTYSAITLGASRLDEWDRDEHAFPLAAGQPSNPPETTRRIAFAGELHRNSDEPCLTLTTYVCHAEKSTYHSSDWLTWARQRVTRTTCRAFEEQLNRVSRVPEANPVEAMAAMAKAVADRQRREKALAAAGREYGRLTAEEAAKRAADPGSIHVLLSPALAEAVDTFIKAMAAAGLPGLERASDGRTSGWVVGHWQEATGSSWGGDQLYVGRPIYLTAGARLVSETKAVTKWGRTTYVVRPWVDELPSEVTSRLVKRLAALAARHGVIPG